MGSSKEKIKKKEAKAKYKIAKARTSSSYSKKSNDLSIRIADIRKDVSVTIDKSGSGRSNLKITGLNPEQMERIIPEINREILITLTEDKRPIRAKAMRFIREGLWETLIKIIAGLVVGYLLIRFGLK